MTSAHRTLLIPLLFIWLVCLAGCAPEPPTSVDLAITDVTLIDAVNPVRHNQTVLIDQGRLVDIIDSGADRRFVAKEEWTVAIDTSFPGCGIFMFTSPLIAALPTPWQGSFCITVSLTCGYGRPAGGSSPCGRYPS